MGFQLSTELVCNSPYESFAFIHLQDKSSLFQRHDGDGRVRGKRFAEIGDLHIKSQGVGIAVVTPNGFEDGVTLYGLADMLSEDGKDFLLAGREVLHHSVYLYG